MRFWRHAAENAGVLSNARRSDHGGLRDMVGNALTVGDVDKVAQIIWQLFKKQADSCSVRVCEDAGMKDVWLDGSWLIADSQRRLHRVQSDDWKGHSAMQVTSVQRGNQLFFQTDPLAPGRQLERTLTL